MRQARNMESVGRLAGGIAHDYKNIFGIIIGYAEMVLEQLAARDPLPDDLKEIFTVGKRSAEITKQLLAFARQQPTALEVLNLNDSIKAMLSMLRRLIGEDIHLIWVPGANV